MRRNEFPVRIKSSDQVTKKPTIAAELFPFHFVLFKKEKKKIMMIRKSGPHGVKGAFHQSQQKKKKKKRTGFQLFERKTIMIQQQHHKLK